MYPMEFVVKMENIGMIKLEHLRILILPLTSVYSIVKVSVSNALMMLYNIFMQESVVNWENSGMELHVLREIKIIVINIRNAKHLLVY
jgi:hypothetical protein